MAPKISAQDRAKKLQEKGIALERKAEYMLVFAKLKDHYELVVEMKKRMINLGILTASGEDNPDYRPPKALGVKEELDDNAGTPVKTEGGAGSKEDDAEEIGNVVLHRNFGTWGSIPPKYMKWLLSRAEPVSLSPFSLKALTKQGAREPQRDLMLEILEAISGFTRSDNIGENKLHLISERVNQENQQRGRILMNVAPPFDWESLGFFSAALVKDQIYELLEKYANVKVQIALDIKDGSPVTVDMNFSRARAVLVYTKPSGKVERMNCMQIFVDAGEGQSLGNSGATINRQASPSQARSPMTAACAQATPPLSPHVPAPAPCGRPTARRAAPLGVAASSPPPAKIARLGLASPSIEPAAAACDAKSGKQGGEEKAEVEIAALPEQVAEVASPLAGAFAAPVLPPDGVDRAEDESDGGARPAELSAKDSAALGAFDEASFVPPKEEDKGQ